ncbi:MAG: nitroreductase [Ruminococcaceae bacterium]|nr:nitroreductase [Oscillospiraceae bacterium]
MDFLEIANKRQSCRKFNPDLPVEREKLEKIIQAGILSPSACNGQPYHFTVCEGETAKSVAKCCTDIGINKFAYDAPVMLVISEAPYCKMAATGAKLKHNDYRSIDIGIASAYITAEAASLGVESCILGWINDKQIREVCGISGAARLVIALGYPKEGYEIRPKKRKDFDELVTFYYK